MEAVWPSDTLGSCTTCGGTGICVLAQPTEPVHLVGNGRGPTGCLRVESDPKRFVPLGYELIVAIWPAPAGVVYPAGVTSQGVWLANTSTGTALQLSIGLP
jgi:hypothetical protein